MKISFGPPSIGCTFAHQSTEDGDVRRPAHPEEITVDYMLMYQETAHDFAQRADPQAAPA